MVTPRYLYKMVCFHVVCGIYSSCIDRAIEPTVVELLPSLSPSQRAGIGYCDVTARVPKSRIIVNTVIFLK